MNGAIWKYQLVVGFNQLTLPIHARFLSVQVQGREPQAWFLVNPRARTEERQFVVVATGMEFDPEDLEYLGTFQLLDGEFVGHLWERQPVEGGRDK